MPVAHGHWLGRAGGHADQERIVVGCGRLDPAPDVDMGFLRELQAPAHAPRAAALQVRLARSPDVVAAERVVVLGDDHDRHDQPGFRLDIRAVLGWHGQYRLFCTRFAQLPDRWHIGEDALSDVRAVHCEDGARRRRIHLNAADDWLRGSQAERPVVASGGHAHSLGRGFDCCCCRGKGCSPGGKGRIRV